MRELQWQPQGGYEMANDESCFYIREGNVSRRAGQIV